MKERLTYRRVNSVCEHFPKYHIVAADYPNETLLGKKPVPTTDTEKVRNFLSDESNPVNKIRRKWAAMELTLRCHLIFLRARKTESAIHIYCSAKSLGFMKGWR